MPTMLSWQNLADGAREIAATREVPGLGVRNLLTETVAEVWRMPAGTPSTDTNLDIDFGAPVQVGVIAVRAPHDGYLPPAQIIRGFGSTVSIGASDALSIPAELMNLPDASGVWWHWPAAPVTLRFLRLQFTVGVGDEYLQLGRLWIGPDFRPAKWATGAGLRRGMGTAGGVERAGVSGVATPLRGATYRITRFALDRMTKAEALTVEDMARAVGVHGQVLAHPQTTEGARGLILGRMLDMPEPAYVAPLLYGAQFNIAEDL